MQTQAQTITKSVTPPVLTTKVTKVVFLPNKYDEKKFKDGCRLILKLINGI